MKKTVAYGFYDLDWRLSEPIFKKSYQEPTESLFTLGKEKGLDFVLTGFMNFKDGYFENGFSFVDKKWLKIGKFKADMIYDKSKTGFANIASKLAINGKVPIINHPIFDLICENKFLSYLYFRNFSPKTFTYRKALEKELLSEIKTKKIVIKPTWGSGGEGVMIIPKREWKTSKMKEESIIQEFIDSSNGVAGIVKDYHDLRMVIINGKIIYSYLRIPKKGSLLANIAQGGHMINLTDEQIPKKAKDLAKKIDKSFIDFWPRIYTIDLMFDEKQKPWLIELNSKPGIYFDPDAEKLQTKFFSGIINSLKSL